MSPDRESRSILGVQQAVRMSLRLATANALPLIRLNHLARREPTALLGVMQYWLGPDLAESETRGDC